MNIILQNYKNKINNLINIYFNNKIESILKEFNNFSINNYLNIISNFDLNMNEFICNAIIELINELDRQYCISKERKCKYHIKDYKKRTILTIFGEIKFYRHYYKSKIDGSSFCYIDRLLGLPKYDYFDPCIKAEILDYVSENNYSETANHLNILINNRLCNNIKYINRQMVRNVVLKSILAKPKYKLRDDTEELFIIADEKWIPTQNNKHKKIMQKSIVIFDKFNKDGKRKSLNNKATFSGRNDKFIYDAIDYIENSYNTSKLKRIYLMGDGATWIDGLKNYFNYNPNIEIIQALDHFHLKQCIWRIKADKSIYNCLLGYIKNNKKDDFKRIIEELIEIDSYREDKLNEYKNYILNHWNNILNLYKYNLSCPMESQISHTFASYFTSMPKAYSTKTIPKLINLRLLKKNNNNIKELYLERINNINNNNNLNFSLFDTKETYTTTINKLDNLLAI